MPADLNMADGLIAVISDFGNNRYHLRGLHLAHCCEVVARARALIESRDEHAAGLDTVTLLTVAFPHHSKP
jgi:hypothetical protein